jgi:hypothetical protein
VAVHEPDGNEDVVTGSFVQGRDCALKAEELLLRSIEDVRLQLRL